MKARGIQKQIPSWIAVVYESPEGQIIKDIIGALVVFIGFNVALVGINTVNVVGWPHWVEKSIHLCHEVSLVAYNVFLVLRLLLYLGWELYDEISR